MLSGKGSQSSLVGYSGASSTTGFIIYNTTYKPLYISGSSLPLHRKNERASKTPSLRGGFVSSALIITHLKLQESHIHDVVRQAQHLETTYGQYFDKNLMFEDVDTARNHVLQVVERLGSQQQWVPASWLDNTVS